MHKRIFAIIGISALLLASCGYNPNTPSYKESLYEAFTPGEYLGTRGIGSRTEKAILTISGDHNEGPADVELAFYSKDPLTEEWNTEPYAVYRGEYRHITMVFSDSPYSEWSDRFHRDEFIFTTEEGTGKYSIDDLSGVTEILFNPSTAKDISEYDYNHHYVPVTGTVIHLYEPGGYYLDDEISSLKDFRWERF